MNALERDVRAAEGAFRLGDVPRATQLLNRIVAKAPEHSRAHELLAYLAGNRGDTQTALRHLKRATSDPRASPQSWYYLGRCFRELGRHAEAAEAIRRALELGGDFFEGLHDLGLAFIELGREEAALECLDRAIGLQPRSVEAHYNRGRALDALKRWNEAIASYSAALELQPDHALSLSNRGASQYDLGHYEEALADQERSIAIDPGNPVAWNNRGAALADLGRREEALASYARSLELDSGNPATWSFRGGILDEMGRGDEALEHFARALERDPEYAEAHWNEAHLRLSRGDFATGWKKYEYRWKRRGAEPSRHSRLPRWATGMSLQGKRILLWAEQGYGDTIQFCRYGPVLAREGARVVIEVPAALKTLVGSLSGCAVYAAGEDLPECDFQIPLLSLPGALETTLETVPAATPYLTASAGRVRHWAGKVKRSGARPAIGIACSGSARHKRDRDRSMALREFAPLEEVADVFVVQTELREPDARFLREEARTMRFVGGEVADFDDTAALVTNLDAVVSVDTSLVHLAGALGKPTWVLLAEVAEWRWMQVRTDSPWYPTATLFRQDRPGDWSGPMARIRREVENLASLRVSGEAQPCS